MSTPHLESATKRRRIMEETTASVEARVSGNASSAKLDSPVPVPSHPPSPAAGPDETAEAEYYFENGLRRVRPYYHTYSTNAKGRWFGRTLLDVFVREFRDQSEPYYLEAIHRGIIMINDQKVTPDTIVRLHDRITHRIHRHEPPVSATPPIRIVHRSDSVVVVDKPASIPVHPSGRYYHNTLIHILRREFGIKSPFLSPANRLDRLTSGLVILALDAATARDLEGQMRSRQVRKEYVCRVLGDFPPNFSAQSPTPAGPVDKDGPRDHQCNIDAVVPNSDGGDDSEDLSSYVVCDEPIKTVAHKLGLVAVHPDGKPSRTLFRPIGRVLGPATIPLVDPTESNTASSHHLKPPLTTVVQCKPLTGRTHQIRVHLQYLGYPIANDPLYCNARVWGGLTTPQTELKAEATIQKAIANLTELDHHQQHHPAKEISVVSEQREPASEVSHGQGPKKADTNDVDPTMTSTTDQQSPLSAGPASSSLSQGSPLSPPPTASSSSPLALPLGFEASCTQCQENIHSPIPDPKPEQRLIWLHAYKYEGDGWSYKTEMPAWSKPKENSSSEADTN
ncbi:DRAP deaminase [Dimargaris cristalligena]|nr:DRAP deaminase [Dimargaris cristalligena]